MRDLEVISHFFSSLEDAVVSLEKSISKNKVEESNKIKKVILDLNKKLIEELS